MKSIKFLAVASAVALLGTAGLTSCNQKNGPDGPGNGNYKGETVKTEFLISIAENAVGKATRYMTGDAVQKDQTIAKFRGMDDIVLVPLTGDDATRTGSNISKYAGNTDFVIPAAGLNAGSQSKYYSDVAVPLGTDRFLFYGKAIDEANADDNVKKHINGVVIRNNMTAADPSSDITFSLQKIKTDLKINGVAVELARYMTSIANVSGWANHANDAIAAFHDDFTDMTAGSSASIEALVRDLYNTLQTYQAPRATRDAVVDGIIDAIEDGANITPPATPGAPYGVALKPSLQGYPANIGLPDGAAVLEWDTDPTPDTFAIVTGASASTTALALDRYVYPASLQYFVSSTIATATTSQASRYTTSSYSWADVLDPDQGSGYDDHSAVKPSTKSVAIEDPIQYGVGQLVADVRIKNSGLKDSKEEAYDCASALTWTGILIGDQKTVNYAFVAPDGVAYTIYDNYMNNLTTPGNPIVVPTSGGDEDYFGFSDPNYTLVFSTQDNIVGEEPGTPGDHVVNVAIELVNNNAAFYGYNGQLIPEGSKFYLVGQLNAQAGTTNKADHPAKYNIFYKDYKTTVHFTIGETSLGKAYNTIPDLRSHNLELGFSVDLAWQAGMIFNLEF